MFCFRTTYVNAIKALGFSDDDANMTAFAIISGDTDRVRSLIVQYLAKVADPKAQRVAGLFAMLDIYRQSYAPITTVAETLKDRLKPEVYQAMMETSDDELNYAQDFVDVTAFSALTLSRGRYLAHPHPKTVPVTNNDGSVSVQLDYGKPIEVPQQMYYRLACAYAPHDKVERMKMYHLLSQRQISAATPTLINLGFKKGMPTSCMTSTIPNRMGGDPTRSAAGGIAETISFVMDASKNGAGHGIDFSQIACSDHAKGTTKLLMSFNEIIEYVNQGQRKGAGTATLHVSHMDIESFIGASNLAGKEGERVRTMKLCVMINDGFMKRLTADDSSWYTFCPEKCPELFVTMGDEWEAHYERYVNDPAMPKIKYCAKELMSKILTMQANFSQPFISFFDNINRKNACSHVDVCRACNLCMEMILISTPGEYTGTCNLSAINLSKFVTAAGEFDYESFGRVTEDVVRFGNRIVDHAYSPHAGVNATNRDMRPLGIGVAGFGDMVHLMKMAVVVDPDAKKPQLNPALVELNRNIWRCMSFHAYKASAELAKIDGPCAKFAGSPASKGILNQDMFKAEGEATGRDYSSHEFDKEYPGQPFSWDDLREMIKENGLRNQTLLSVQPTASTAQIMNVSEAAEFYTNHLYMRRVIHGEYPVINEHLMNVLEERGYRTAEVMAYMHNNRGSIYNMKEIPKDIRARFPVMWDLPNRLTIDLAADRQVYMCHSQSMNLYANKTDEKSLLRTHMYSWEKGIKTGVYYLQSRAASKPYHFGFDPVKMLATIDDLKAGMVDDAGECMNCNN